MTQPDPRAIARYLDGRSTPQEQLHIEAWLDASADHRRFLDEQRTFWEFAGSVEPPRSRFEGSAADSWKELHGAIRRSDAAVEHGEATDPADRPSRSAAKRNRDGRPRQSGGRASKRHGSRTSTARFAAFAAALVVLIAAVWLVTQVLDRDNSRSESAFTVIETPPGQRARIPLDDGTFVRLNVASKIRFPNEFNGGPREVYLEGEAFFEVSEDSTRPFIVHAYDAAVRVLGTAFNVRAYDKDQAVNVVVARGKIALTDSVIQGNDAVILTAGQMGRVDGGRPERVSDRVDVTRHVAWMEGRLVFEDEPLHGVAVELGRWYMLDVEIADAALADWRLTASFKNESIDEILSVIAASVNVRYSRNREKVTFYQ